MAVSPLTSTEQAVLGLEAEGKTRAEIGAVLGLKETRVKAHLSSIRDTLGAVTNANAVAIAYREGWLK